MTDKEWLERLSVGEKILIGEYMIAELIEKKPKTQVWNILTGKVCLFLGVIKWFNRWRQYCFFPVKETVFSDKCLQDIQVFIKNLKGE